MRVHFVHPDLGIGGAERLVVDAAMGLKQLGHDVVLYTSHHDPRHCFDETRNGSLKVIVRGDIPQPKAIAAFSLVFAILRNLYLCTSLLVEWLMGAYMPPDVYFVDQLSIGIPLLRLTGAKIFFYGHYPDQLLTQRQSFLKYVYRLPLDWIEEQTTALSDRIVSNSQFTSSVFQSTFPRLGQTTEVLYPGIQLSAYNQPFDIQEATIRPLNNTTKRRIVSINRFERKKNIGLCIKAFATLKTKLSAKEFDQLQLVVAGGYDERVRENVDHHLELQHLANHLELTTSTWWRNEKRNERFDPSANVLFVPSFSNSQRQFLLGRSLCLVYTPSHEHFGIVPIEAMVSRLPVIAVNSGGPMETVVEGTGWLCEPTAEAFGARLLDVVQMSESDRLATGERGHQWVMEKFSLDAFAKRLDRMLQTLVQQPPSLQRRRHHTWILAVLLLSISLPVLFMIRLCSWWY